MQITANPFATAQRNHDRAEPAEHTDPLITAGYFREDELSFVEPKYRNGSRYHVTDEQIEKFIVDLVTAPNRDIFIENYLGLTPSWMEQVAVQIAIARQWVRNKEAIGDLISPVFWTWAKQACLTAVSMGWSADMRGAL